MLSTCVESFAFLRLLLRIRRCSLGVAVRRALQRLYQNLLRLLLLLLLLLESCLFSRSSPLLRV